MVGPRRPKFVLFGSSIVQFSYMDEGWGAILADLYSRRADVIVRGYAGWNSGRALQVINQVFPKDSIEQPSLAIVYFGGNDSKRNTTSHIPLPHYLLNMELIIEHLKGLPGRTRAIFLSTPVVNVQQIVKTYGGDQGYSNETCANYSDALVELCKKKDVAVVDLWTALQQHPHWEDVCFRDGIHFTHEGSKIVVREILKVLKHADWNPSLFWRSMPVEFSQPSQYDLVDGVAPVDVANIVPEWQQEWDF